jgi:hypothetical protein
MFLGNNNASGVFQPTPAAIIMISASAALGLLVSLSTFLVIGHTSALTYNVVGHIKTVGIIAGGVVFYQEVRATSPIRPIFLDGTQNAPRTNMKKGALQCQCMHGCPCMPSRNGISWSAYTRRRNAASMNFADLRFDGSSETIFLTKWVLTLPHVYASVQIVGM